MKLSYQFPLGRTPWKIHGWNLQITHLERKMIFQTPMIMFHVNLQGCNHDVNPNGPFDEHASRPKRSFVIFAHTCRQGGPQADGYQ